MEYIRTYTSIPVPHVYFYESNPYNRLGGEYIIMSKVRSAFAPVLNHVIYTNAAFTTTGGRCSTVLRIPVHVI